MRLHPTVLVLLLVALRVSAGMAIAAEGAAPAAPAASHNPTSSAASHNTLETLFAHPPDAAKPWVFWYWMKGAISREGLTADLEAMQRVGIGGAYLVPIQDVSNPPLYSPAVRTLTPEWWEMLRHTFREADRLGLKMAMHPSDGFATAGGPWITPELSMKKVTASETTIPGDRRFDGPLPRPPAKEDFYRDIAVLAFPAPEGAGVSTRTVVPKVTSSVADFEAQQLVRPGNLQRLRSETAAWIQFEFAQPFTARSLVVRPDGRNYPVLRLIVEASDDGKSFRRVTRLIPPRHGWQDGDADYTYALPATTARFFRFVHDPADPEPGAEDLDSAKWRNVFKVLGLELFASARIPSFEGKSGAVWRRSERATSELLPAALCVDPETIVDLTARLSPDGRLCWDVPPGNWTILRIGYTSTGHRNETAGAGKGLECDKLDPAAVRLQFDRWFGETVRQVGPELAARVLTTFHVDSWECGSQNWTPAFADEFRRRRGYDLTPYLPAFAGIPVGSAESTERVLFDVRLTVSELTQQSFFETLAALAHERGLKFTAEATAPVMMGDAMQHFAVVDVPMGEFWLRSPTHDKPTDILDAISGARIYGKPVVMAEAFTSLSNRWDEHPGMLKALGDHQFALGNNRLLLHVFTHNPWTDRRPGVTLGGLGLYCQRDQTWWDLADGWIGYLTRCSALLQHGRPVADVAYFTGEELPARAILPERRQPALPAGYAADSINRDALLRLATVQDGRLVLPGGASYAVLVLPPDSIPPTPALAAKLQELREAGLPILGGAFEQGPASERRDASERGPAPERRDSDPPAIESRRSRGEPQANPVAATLKQAGVAPDLLAFETGAASDAPPAGERTPVPAAGIEWTHRTSPEGEIYFVSNQLDQAREIVVRLRVTGRLPRLLDPVTGKPSLALRRWEVGSKTTELQLSLAAHESVFVVCDQSLTEGEAAFAGFDDLPANTERIHGPWTVVFDPARGGPAQPVVFSQLLSWSEHADPAIRHYSGEASYSTTFQWTPGDFRRVSVDLGAIANLGRVMVNGIDCGSAWTPPYRVEITGALRPGANTLTIRVANTWANRLRHEATLPEAQRLTWTTAPLPPPDSALLPAGLLGPVEIVTTAVPSELALRPPESRNPKLLLPSARP